MSNTEETTTPETPVPVDKIEPFFLTPGAHRRILEGNPDDYIPKEALPYLRQEPNSKTNFGVHPSEKVEWSQARIEAVGGGQVCPYCDEAKEVERKCVGAVTGIQIFRMKPCECKMFRNFYTRWLNPDNVAKGYRDVKLDDFEKFCNNLKNFNYDPQNPDAPSSFKNLLATVREYKHNCYLLFGGAGIR